VLRAHRRPGRISRSCRRGCRRRLGHTHQPRGTSMTVTPAAAPGTLPGGIDPSPQTTHAPLLPAVMRSEWTKLRSVRSTIWSLVATFAITFGFGTLFCFAYVSRYDRLSVREHLSFDPTAQSLRGIFLAELAIGVLGVLVISAEYATGVIRPTFIAAPQR